MSSRGRRKVTRKTSVISVKINENNEIECMEMDENSQDTQDSQYLELSSEPPSPAVNDPNHLLVDLHEETVVEHVCGKCGKIYRSLSALKNHLERCRSVDYDNYQEDEASQKDEDSADDSMLNEDSQGFDVVQVKEEDDNSITVENYQITPSVFKKPLPPKKESPKKVRAKKVPREKGKNVSKKLCYCCDEDLASAHMGHIKCKQCPKSFKGHKNLAKHISMLHSPITYFPCTLCKATCPNQEILDLHIEAHKTGKPFSCQKCGKDFTRKYHLERHLTHTGCDRARPKVELPCEVCGKVFSRIDNLREHLRGHMGQTLRRKDYQCPHCEKAFYGLSLLNIHIRTHTGERPFACDLCPKSFPSNGALRKHRRMHTGEKPYECKTCSARFSAKETLNRHVKIHTGDRPHKCDICGNSFIQATQLRAHMFHHTGEHGFQCKYCKKSFNRKARLVSHIKYTHEGQTPFECAECGRTYLRKEELVRHMEMHNGIKNYICETCNKRFTTRTALNSHLHIHQPVEPSACSECGKVFIRVDCLLRHMKSKHRSAVEEILINAEKKKINDRIRELGVVIENVPIVFANEDDDFDGTTYIIEEVPEIATQETLEVIPYNEEGNDEDQTIIKVEDKPKERRVATSQRKQRAQRKVAKRADVKDELSDESIFMSDEALKESITKLLSTLINADTLKNLGWPDEPVENVLSALIRQCGHTPSDYTDCVDYTSKMRENAKILFTVVIENDVIKSMLNNHTVDEVIKKVLKLAKGSS
ncbi:zinc finger protein 436 [Lutzomyia longipalpis]|uniref:zinc finger protein 436 n=1 Tax=Lutzomyia longipalpis TaxID=7200 RepID=UPI002483AC59|nr:zinc finger protein 436 [Lutzomyia longipalpis]